MRVEISKPTKDYLLNKYPQLNESIIQHLFLYGEIEQKCINSYPLSPFDYYIGVPYDVLKISKVLAREYSIDREIYLIPDEDGIIYKIYQEE